MKGSEAFRLTSIVNFADGWQWFRVSRKSVHINFGLTASKSLYREVQFFSCGKPREHEIVTVQNGESQ